MTKKSLLRRKDLQLWKMSQKMKFGQDWFKHLCSENPEQNIQKKVNKSSKIAHD